MNIYVTSDWHLNFSDDNVIIPAVVKQVKEFNCQKLILAGDIYFIDEVDIFLNELSDKLSDVDIIYVPGNHEFYGYDFNAFILDGLRQKLSPRVFVLDGGQYIHGKLVIHGITGWIDESWKQIHYPRVVVKGKFLYKNYSDFSAIRNFESTLEKGKEDFKNLIRDINLFDESFTQVVVTHFMPCKEFVSLKFAGSPLNPCFANDWLDKIQTLPIKYWIYGHTHEIQTHNINGIKFICNPVGYPFEQGYAISPYVISI